MEELIEKYNRLKSAYDRKVEHIKSQYPELTPSMLLRLTKTKTYWHRKRLDTLANKIHISKY